VGSRSIVCFVTAKTFDCVFFSSRLRRRHWLVVWPNAFFLEKGTENPAKTVFAIEVVLTNNVETDYYNVRDDSNDHDWTVSCIYDKKVIRRFGGVRDVAWKWFFTTRVETFLQSNVSDRVCLGDGRHVGHGRHGETFPIRQFDTAQTGGRPKARVAKNAGKTTGDPK